MSVMTSKQKADRVIRELRALPVAKRIVRRLRCIECGHLKTEHIKNAACGTFVMETVTLPVCIACNKRTCNDEADDLCEKCWGHP